MSLVFLLSLLFLNVTNADQCVYTDKETAQSAATILEGSSEVLEFYEFEKRLEFNRSYELESVDVLDRGDSYVVSINSDWMELAHTYVKFGDEYLNLAILVGCKHNGVTFSLPLDILDRQLEFNRYDEIKRLIEAYDNELSE